jgi:hypothetical protein
MPTPATIRLFVIAASLSVLTLCLCFLGIAYYSPLIETLRQVAVLGWVGLSILSLINAAYFVFHKEPLK